jgi:hypothetical protein
VHLLALARQDRRVDRLRQERVAKAEAAARLVGHEHAVLMRLAQCLPQRVLRERSRRAQQRIAHLAPCGRGEAQHAPRRAVEPGDALQEDVAQPRGQPVVRGGEQLLGEERVALGPRGDRVAQRRLGRARLRREQGGQLLAGERAQLEHEPVRAQDAVGHPAHAVGGGRLVRASRGEHQQPAVAQVVGEEDVEVERGRVRPVQILEHEQRRLRGAALREQRQRILEHAQLRAARVIAAGELAEGLRERLVRQLGAGEVDRAPDQHGEAGRAGLRLQLAGEPRLADARLAGDQHARAVPRARRRERAAQRRELGGASDERRHAASIRARAPRPQDTHATGRGYACPADARGREWVHDRPHDHHDRSADPHAPGRRRPAAARARVGTGGRGARPAHPRLVPEPPVLGPAVRERPGRRAAARGVRPARPRHV